MAYLKGFSRMSSLVPSVKKACAHSGAVWVEKNVPRYLREGGLVLLSRGKRSKVGGRHVRGRVRVGTHFFLIRLKKTAETPSHVQLRTETMLQAMRSSITSWQPLLHAPPRSSA